VKNRSTLWEFALAAGTIGLIGFLSNQKPNKKQSATGDSSDHAEKINPGWHRDEHEHRTKESDFWQSQITTSKRTANFSVLAFVAAVAAAIIAAFAYGETKRQADIADQSMRASNRAYVNSSIFRVVSYGGKTPEGKLWWVVSPVIENTGNTGTHHMLISGAIRIGGDDTWDDDQGRFYQALLLPKSEITDGIISMTEYELNQMGGNVNLIGIGTIAYDDIFGDPHLTEFCHVPQILPADWETIPMQPLRFRGLRCPKHNCEDDECGTDWRDRVRRIKKKVPAPK
jgi:hypothetical protein